MRSSSMAVKKSEEGDDQVGVRTGIKVLFMVIFTGIVMIWIMAPTNTYRKIWRPKIQSKANQSTYFGSQGTTLLIFTFPMLSVAVLGSLFLHLQKNANDNTPARVQKEKRRQCLARWKKPVLVKGPLGIVSGIELSFLLMFTALLIWSFTTYLKNSFATLTPEHGQKLWEVKLESAALRIGLVGNVCLAFLFFPVARGSSVLGMFGLTSEGSIKYHIWLGHALMVLFTAHGLCFIIYWAITHQISQMIKWQKYDISNLAGEISLVCGLVMWATTFPRIRRKFFELFFYTHHLYILFVLFFILHVGISYSFMMLPGFYLFVVDRFLRVLQSRRRVRLISARLLPCQTLELNFSKSPDLSYNPTSVVFLNVPAVSKLQWHPFTVASSGNLEPEKLSVVIKSEGSWSTKLYQMLSAPSPVDRLEVSIEGPYGPVSSHFLRHDTLVMVSGGSGITPFISVIRELISASQTQKIKTPRLLLICSFKNSLDLSMLDLILPSSGTSSELSNLQLQIEAYVTREIQPSLDNSKLVRTLWFKPQPTDAPMSAILGPNSWLWLGAIISSSFAIFLILIGIIGRYYIYSIDHNTNKVFPYPAKAVLYVLVICVSIAATASAAVLWNKKRLAKETKQIENVEGPTPTTSPGAWYNAADRELESLPHQSLAQSINLHYGKRPDLKRILFDCEGSSVGVLVCGPKNMRHEVATICSSGLADNLYFESISFSW